MCGWRGGIHKFILGIKLKYNYTVKENITLETEKMEEGVGVGSGSVRSHSRKLSQLLYLLIV